MRASEITDLWTCAAYLRARQRTPPIELRLPREVIAKIRADANSMRMIKMTPPAPHSKQNPWGQIDAELYRWAEQLRAEAPMKVYGVKIVEASP
jgi:hypothetical protein